MNEELSKNIQLKTETLTRKQLAKEILVEGKLDPRFSTEEEVGVFGPYYLERDDITSGESWFPIIRLNGLIVGVAYLTPAPFSNKYMTLDKFILDKNFRGFRRSSDERKQEFRLSERLIMEVIRFAKKRKVGLSIPFFTKQGRERIREKIIAQCTKEKVPLLIPGSGTEVLLQRVAVNKEK